MSKLTLIELSDNLKQAIKDNDQYSINFYAYEIVCRIYVPFNGKHTFEELLVEFGYKEIEKRTRTKNE